MHIASVGHMTVVRKTHDFVTWKPSDTLKSVELLGNEIWIRCLGFSSAAQQMEVTACPSVDEFDWSRIRSNSLHDYFEECDHFSDAALSKGTSLCDFGNPFDFSGSNHRYTLASGAANVVPQGTKKMDSACDREFNANTELHPHLSSLGGFPSRPAMSVSLMFCSTFTQVKQSQQFVRTADRSDRRSSRRWPVSALDNMTSASSDTVLSEWDNSPIDVMITCPRCSEPCDTLKQCSHANVSALEPYLPPIQTFSSRSSPSLLQDVTVSSCDRWSGSEFPTVTDELSLACNRSVEANQEKQLLPLTKPLQHACFNPMFDAPRQGQGTELEDYSSNVPLMISQQPLKVQSRENTALFAYPGRTWDLASQEFQSLDLGPDQSRRDNDSFAAFSKKYCPTETPIDSLECAA
nr:hypothetical protein CFP56_50824 [Quercus suber]